MTPLTCAEAEELAALQAFDALDAESRAALEAHLAACEACRQAQRAMAETVGALAYASQRPLRPEVKARLMARVADKAPLANAPVAAPGPSRTPAATGWGRRERILAACAVVLGVGLSGALLRVGQMQNELASANDRLAQLVASSVKQNQELTTAQAELQNARLGARSASADADLLASQDVRMVPMQMKPQVQKAEAWVYWSPAHHAWLATFRGLPSAGPRKTYQLWAVTPDKKLSMGTFEAGPDGVARVHATMPPNGKPMAAAVTLEPAGGMPNPTGPIVMVGPIKQL